MTEPGRSLPDLPTQATLSDKQVHIPDINGRKTSLSPSLNNAQMMNPMQLHANNNNSKEPTKSPQPSAFASNKRNAAIDMKDEEMAEASALSNKTNIPAMQPDVDEKMTE
jgi:microcystin-dependent protein